MMIAPLKQGVVEPLLFRALQHIVAVLQYVATDPPGGHLVAVSATPSVRPAAWMLTRQRVKERLAPIIELTKDERQRLADAVANDVRFHTQFGSHTFAFQWWNLPEHVREAAGEFLQEFYVILMARDGFPKAFAPKSHNRLSGYLLEDALRLANTTKVCPACLGPLQERVFGRSTVDRDHFLPKTFYPMLAVHPHNLVLVCAVCNGRIKRDQDPLLVGWSGKQLKSAGAAITRAKAGRLVAVAKPYSAGLHGELLVKFPVQGAAHGVALEALSNAEPWKSRVAGIDALYGVSEHWRQRLEAIHEHLIDDCTLGRAIVNRTTIEGLLRARCEQLESKLFRYGDNYLRWHYAKWMLAEKLSRFVADCQQRISEGA